MKRCWHCGELNGDDALKWPVCDILDELFIFGPIYMRGTPNTGIIIGTGTLPRIGITYACHKKEKWKRLSCCRDREEKKGYTRRKMRAPCSLTWVGKSIWCSSPLHMLTPEPAMATKRKQL
ncbi:uncharacterized protein LOC114876503 isoform X2 [Osmia bicornis bicornis]|uniref:uncharacterized protein LOC114876503 isoform X2 n=1 Tax=Osmia bicornis bicornis TaxID=1437191 RepID=UPI001EAF342B|nr:uncharacterized protein LOC114876503 isoform X2 [Osmia bicornis bicornis]